MSHVATPPRAGRFLGTLFVVMAAAVSPGQDSAPKKDPLPPGALRRLGTVPPAYGEPSQGHTGGVYELAFSPDGKRLVSRGSDEKDAVRIWDTATGKELHKLDGYAPIAYSPDGKTLITGGPEEDRLLLWDARRPEAPASQIEAKNVKALRVLPDGQSAVMIKDVGTTEYVDLITGKATKTVRTRWASPLVFSADGKMLAFTRSMYDPLIHFCNAETGKELPGLLQGKRNRVSVARFSPDGRLLAAGGLDNLVHLWQIGSPQQLLAVLKGHTKRIVTLTFSPDGRFLVSGGLDRAARVWDLTTGEEIAVLQGHSGNLTAVALSPDGDLLATGSGDTTILLWDFWTAALGRPPVPVPLDEARLKALWSDLAEGPSAKQQLHAVGLLSQAPRQAVALVKEKMQTYVAEAQLDRILELIEQLDDDRYRVRKEATLALLRLRKNAEPVLRKALQEAVSQEVRFRLRLILSQPGSTPSISNAEKLRYRRVVLLLQRLGSPPARELLDQLATVFPDRDVQHEAKQTLAVMDRRLPPKE